MSRESGKAFVRVFRLSALAFCGLMVAGCQAPPDPQPPTSVATPLESPVASEDFIPEAVLGGSALENQPFVDYLLRTELERTSGRAGSAALLQVLLDSGFLATALEFTPDNSLTELPADSTSIAIRINDECLITQWGSDWYASSVEAVLVTDTCLLGRTKTLD